MSKDIFLEPQYLFKTVPEETPNQTIQADHCKKYISNLANGNVHRV
jgi:hypothetical protein